LFFVEVMGRDAGHIAALNAGMLEPKRFLSRRGLRLERLLESLKKVKLW
jgi:6-phosphofructokinase